MDVPQNPLKRSRGKEVWISFELILVRGDHNWGGVGGLDGWGYFLCVPFLVRGSPNCGRGVGVGMAWSNFLFDV